MNSRRQIGANGTAPGVNGSNGMPSSRFSERPGPGVQQGSGSPYSSGVSGMPGNTAGPVSAGAVSGAGVSISTMPVNAGHPLDLNHLYEMVTELGNVLKQNRETTQLIINGTEEVMRRQAGAGEGGNIHHQTDAEAAAARIADLEQALAHERMTKSVLLAEQQENLSLISAYEDSMTEVVSQIRNYCQNQNLNLLAQRKHYNHLLQEERDAHLQSRMERDHWHDMAVSCGEMVRQAYRLRSEEEEDSVRVVEALQNEVRALRGALGMNRQDEEDETGWEVLKDYASTSSGPD